MARMTYSWWVDAANKPSLLVRFRTTSPGTSDYAYLDMVEITGKAEALSPAKEPNREKHRERGCQCGCFGRQPDQ